MYLIRIWRDYHQLLNHRNIFNFHRFLEALAFGQIHIFNCKHIQRKAYISPNVHDFLLSQIHWKISILQETPIVFSEQSGFIVNDIYIIKKVDFRKRCKCSRWHTHSIHHNSSLAIFNIKIVKYYCSFFMHSTRIAWAYRALSISTTRLPFFLHIIIWTKVNTSKREWQVFFLVLSICYLIVSHARLQRTVIGTSVFGLTKYPNILIVMAYDASLVVKKRGPFRVAKWVM